MASSIQHTQAGPSCSVRGGGGEGASEVVVPTPAGPAAPSLAGCLVYVPASGAIPFLAARVPRWKKALLKHGGDMTQDGHAPGITHVLLGTDRTPPAVSELLQRPGSSVVAVSPAWLEQSILKNRRLRESDFLPPPIPPKDGLPPVRAWSGSDSSTSEEELESEVELRARWLGEYWHPGCEAMSQTELCLQAVYDEARSKEIGNAPLVQAIIELRRYEEGLHQDYFTDRDTGVERKLNHRALRYAKVAGAVRACSYRLVPPVRPGQLPFVGDASAKQLTDILKTGSCAALDSFRADAEVTDSQGKLRRNSAGGRTRAAFNALPGVGQRTAQRWWDLGLRSYEDVEAAMEPGGFLETHGAPPSVEQVFSIKHRSDLLEGTSAAEVEEMEEALCDGLAAVSGPGWRIELVGGGRRGTAVHDADYLVTHPELSLEGVLPRLLQHWIGQQRMLSPKEAMCRVQAGLMPGHIEKLKRMHLHEASAAPSIQVLDKFDHVYGIYRLRSGRHRRLDVIAVPPEEWAVAQVGWIGSRTYLRLMRQHAKDLGMWATSHQLFRKVGGEARIVPDEAAPLGRDGRERWPPGWAPGRRVAAQRDVFELLGIPYREERQRNCP